MKLQKITGNWADCLEKARGKKIASGKEILEHIISEANHSWILTTDCTIRIPKHLLLARAEFNPLIAYAQKAVDLSRTYRARYEKKIEKNGTWVYERYGDPPVLSLDDFVEESEHELTLLDIAREDEKKPIEERRILDLGDKSSYILYTRLFEFDPVMRWIAQSKDLAREFGQFLYNQSGNYKTERIEIRLPSRKCIESSINAHSLNFIGVPDAWSSPCFDGDYHLLYFEAGKLCVVDEDEPASQKE